MKVVQNNKTAREIAEEEFAAEKRKENVAKFKDKLKALDKANAVVRAIEAEIADLGAELEESDGEQQDV